MPQQFATPPVTPGAGMYQQQGEQNEQPIMTGGGSYRIAGTGKTLARDRSMHWTCCEAMSVVQELTSDHDRNPW